MENKNRVFTIAFLLISVFLIILLAWWFLWREPPLPEGLVQANGRIEGDHYTVAGKWSGRVANLLAREGDQVEKGQILIEFDDAQIVARVKQAKAGVNAVKAKFKAAQTSVTIFKKMVPLKVDTANAAVMHAKATIVSVKASEFQTRKDMQRFRALLKSHTVEKHRSEQADLAWKVAKAQLGWEQIKAREYEVAVLAAQVTQAEAKVEEALSTLDDLTIKAPATGMITTRIVNAGEVVTAGTPLYDIVDLDKLYLKVYVAEKNIGKVRMGLPAQIYSDAFSEQPFPATVRYIASQAEFTPKEVQTPDERVKLVYAVKLYLDENPDHRLTPGLPADAIIRWQQQTPWARPQW